LCERVSPKKTIAGFIWGFLGGVVWWAIFVFLLQKFFIIKYVGIGKFMLLAVSLLTVFFVQLGDLFESRVKRLADVKDSSSLLLGHGGVWDRFDGFLFALPVYYYLLIYIINTGG
jgi:phosphatidate cytidylyltransferase